jgi:hypothetical protein
MAQVRINDPPFELDKDWAMMREGSGAGQQGVSFPMFEAWWKKRAGIGETDLPVIPLNTAQSTPY